MADKSLADLAREKWDALRGHVEHLNLQLHLGAAEALERFEQQKGELRTHLSELREQIEDLPAEHQEFVEEINDKIDDLERAANTARADTVLFLSEQKQDLKTAILALRKYLGEHLEQGNEELQHFVKKLDLDLEIFLARFELFELQIELMAGNAAERYDSGKKELLKRFDNLRDRMQTEVDAGGDRIDHFNKEMGEAWKHFKKGLGFKD